ncbi:hypothetical protein CCHL11_05186 [Colletotrichum chlorophyti]|uniref:Uncharacterized protein n=1 Tax=Colletotrichum chlorophyti TaxID=708187 RepID=A0A1Q8RP50_9PEZI|nr:hypothetical protein CCHL11_05186 [Colletotrichum chlorophyti]
MSRNNSVPAVQGFSISQPFLGAALHFYPALGSRELDTLIDAYVSGSASIQEKRATVSMDFFSFSQLTGETFKYYPVASASFTSTTSSAKSSPLQDSGYSSNHVSPIISDWSWSQSTPSPASVATPKSFSQETTSSITSKKVAASAAKSQTNDFSHLPGMKIMTKDGRDVTNSASRGCKTKEQRDHAHLMRIIKACDACKKKKVRCDPSHKKRAAPQSQTATSARLAKKTKTAATAKDTRAITERPQSEAIALFTTTQSFTEPAFASFEIPDMPVDLSDSWESFVQFDDEPINTAIFDYDFFADPAGHLTPESTQSPATPSMVFAQPFGNLQNARSSKPAQDQLNVLSPALPYMDASATNYVDFNLYSPEPSFLDDDATLFTDIGSAVNQNQVTRSEGHGLAQNRQSPSSEQLDDHRLPVSPGSEYVVQGAGINREAALLVDHGRRSLPRGARLTTPAFSEVLDDLNCPSTQRVSPSESVFQSSLFLGFSPMQTVRSQQVAETVHPTSPSQGRPPSQPPRATTSSASDVPGAISTISRFRLVQGATGPSSITGGLASHGVSSNARDSTVTAFSSLSTSQPLCYTSTTTARTPSTGGSDCVGSTDSRASGTSTNVYCGQVTAPRASESYGTTAPLRSGSSASLCSSLNEDLFVMAAVAGDGFSMRRSLVGGLPTLQVLVFVVLALAAIGIVASSLEAPALGGGFLQLAFGLVIYKAYHSNSCHDDLRPQQSRLSTTPKPHGFSDGARLLSCVSTRLRHSRRQNQDAHCQARPAWSSMVLGLAQGLR